MIKPVLIALLVLISTFLLAQEEQEKEQPEKVKDVPVREAFLSGILIDNQTTYVPPVGTFEYLIQHKFGSMSNGISDIFGLYAAGSYIRMGCHYVPKKNLQLGYGLSRLRMYNDFSIKYTLLEQTRKNRVPVALGVYGNVAFDARAKESFGNNYRITNRFSYFSQLIIGRKFGEHLTLQANTSFTHYNITDPGVDHDKVSVGINGRININYKSSIIFQYDLPLKLKEITEFREFTNPPQANLGIGWEIRTSAHVFHLYVTTTEGLIPQHNALFNQNNWMKGQVRFGFTITRLYNFS